MYTVDLIILLSAIIKWVRSNCTTIIIVENQGFTEVFESIFPNIFFHINN